MTVSYFTTFTQSLERRDFNITNVLSLWQDQYKFGKRVGQREPTLTRLFDENDAHSFWDRNREFYTSRIETEFDKVGTTLERVDLHDSSRLDAFRKAGIATVDNGVKKRLVPAGLVQPVHKNCAKDWGDAEVRTTLQSILESKENQFGLRRAQEYEIFRDLKNTGEARSELLREMRSLLPEASDNHGTYSTVSFPVQLLLPVTAKADCLVAVKEHVSAWVGDQYGK